jgi:hypothetical protein
VLYELLADQPPLVHGDDVLANLRAICEVQPPPPSAVAPRDIPPALDAIVMRALGKRAADRYPTIADLARELQAFLGGAVRPARLPRLLAAALAVATTITLVATTRPAGMKLRPPPIALGSPPHGILVTAR